MTLTLTFFAAVGGWLSCGLLALLIFNNARTVEMRTLKVALVAGPIVFPIIAWFWFGECVMSRVILMYWKMRKTIK